MGALIIPEYKIRDFINQMPTISYPDGERNIQFGWGDKKELNKYLMKKGIDSYPLVWLLGPSTERHIDQLEKAERDCSFVIATLETRTDLYNPQRYEGSFSKFLNPVNNYLVQGMRNANTTRVLNNDVFNITKHPNYSDESQGDQSGSIELWDAIRTDCTIEFNNSCLKQLKWIAN